jgi:plastocyanin
MSSIVRAVRITGVALVLATVACGGSTDPGGGGGTNPGAGGGGGGGGGGTGGGTSGGGTPGSTVMVTNNTFTPDNMTVSVGAVVTFKWDTCSNDSYGYSTCAKHTVTFNDGETSDTLSTGTFTRKFNAAGTYAYKCSVHGTYMSGTIVVK